MLSTMHALNTGMPFHNHHHLQSRNDMPRLRTECSRASFTTTESSASAMSAHPRTDSSFSATPDTLPMVYGSWDRAPLQDGSDGVSSYAVPMLPTQGYASHVSSAASSRALRYNDDSREPIRPVAPSWYGYVEFTEDALKIIEACITRQLTPVHRRPDENERPQIIRSGAVFVYDETTTGISRWTDDRNWSPSRVRGSFMLYRELDDKVLPGEKKKALKRSRLPSNDMGPTHRGNGEKSRREDESSILGSHHDSYPYKKEGGLMKRTFSAYQGENKWSVISYYDPEDVTTGRLPRVRDEEHLRDIQPRIASQKYSQSPISSQSSNDQQLPPNKLRKQSNTPMVESSYDHKHHVASSYPTPPMVDGIPEQVSYSHEIPAASTLRTPPYDSPGYSPATTFAPTYPQAYPQGYSHSQPQYQYAYHSYPPQLPPNMNGQVYHMQPQPSPAVDNRGYQAHMSAPPSRRGSVPQQHPVPMHHPQPNGHYHESHPAYFPSPPDSRKYDQQQPTYSGWNPHDERQFPPPRYARPN